MKQTGYIIENLLDKTKYFTSTSSYDRPNWVSPENATVYESVDSAERAIKKMIKYGVNSVRMVNLAELAPPASANRQQQLPPREEIQPQEVQQAEPQVEPQAAPTQEEPAGDEMVASHQESVCPECGHEPCTCEGHQQGEEIDVDRDVPEENEEITNRATSFQRGHTVSYKGQEFVVVGDVGNGIVQIAQSDDPNNVARVNAAELLPVHESVKVEEPLTAKSTDVDVSADPETKVSVPAEAKSGLAAVIKKYTDEAEKFNGRDDARASFAMTVAAAATEIKELLDAGTVEALKQAQVRMSTFMNPITSLFPAEVLKFVNSGGRKPTLKDLFDSKRTK